MAGVALQLTEICRASVVDHTGTWHLALTLVRLLFKLLLSCFFGGRSLLGPRSSLLKEFWELGLEHAELV